MRLTHFLTHFLVPLVALHLRPGLALSLPGGDHGLPGWKGEAILEDGVSEIQLGKEDWRGEIHQLSWKPRAFLLKGFLTEDECDHIIALAKPHMEKSEVADEETGQGVESDVRTSTGTFLETAQDETIAAIEKRVAQVTMIPEEHQESLQVLHYRSGQRYEPHHDFFTDEFNARRRDGGQRAATVLMYLTTPEEGGETVFPDADRTVTGPEWSECARQGLAVKAVRGDAMMFFSLHPDGSEDESSLHGSCPTTAGHKWSATKWIRVAEIGEWDEEPDEAEPEPQEEAGGGAPCADRDDDCKEWADTGECQANPTYMRANCPRSCSLC